ncbi:energy transducer TonB [Pseudoalteromonas sp. T1lg23B]|uniref:energy transducer TonB n=1 Tax=Pseudoalteromonas sp. T1lg23B TaxID=2077097 RepID=UPI000CF5DD3E|nr:energy transducer TonB [Pseudoalteromonas sp. T1lg23B]
MPYTSRALLLTSALLCSTASAQPDVREQFNQNYRAYQQAVEKHEDFQEIERYAKLAYEQGRAVFGEQTENTANLIINYAKSIAFDNKEEALNLLDRAIATLEKIYGDNAVELIDSYMLKADWLLPKKDLTAREYISKSLEIAKQSGNKLLESTVYFEAAKTLNIVGDYSRAKSYLRHADEINQQHLPKDSVHRLTVDLWVAELLAARKQNNNAIEKLNQVVAVFDEKLDFDHPLELVAHSRLVGLYERLGKRELATRHCVAIAKMKPWQDDIEQTPLYRIEPIYPTRAARARKEGWVDLEFTVTPEGFVEDIKVLDKEHGEMFVKNSIKALKDWRYAPKFVDGEAVSAKTSVRLAFKMSR